MEPIEELKIILREKDCPFFSDEELMYHLEKQGTLEKAAYRCLLLKAENTSVSVSGMNLPDDSQYYRKLAQQYRPSNSGTLKGG